MKISFLLGDYNIDPCENYANSLDSCRWSTFFDHMVQCPLNDTYLVGVRS